MQVKRHQFDQRIRPSQCAVNDRSTSLDHPPFLIGLRDNDRLGSRDSILNFFRFIVPLTRTFLTSLGCADSGEFYPKTGIDSPDFLVFS